MRKVEAGPKTGLEECPGSDLLSHPVTRAVPSALEGLTSGFGMGPGVSPPPWPPKRLCKVLEHPELHSERERTKASAY